MAKKILIIKVGSTVKSLLEKGRDFEDWFTAGLGLESAEVLVCSLHLGEALPLINSVRGIVITGSAAYVTEEEPWNFVGADFIRAAHQHAIPILGVCYGHQLIAWTFGGRVDFHPAGREIGTVSIRLTAAGKEDALLGELPDPFVAQASHKQSVMQLPDGAVHLAANEFDVHHAFRLGTSTWGVQFHPEFNEEIIRAYLLERRETLLAEGLDVEVLLNAVVPTPEAGALLQRFARLAQNLA